MLVSINHDNVIEVIGEDKFNELCEKYAGHTLYFPKKRNPFNTTDERNEWIFWAFMTGKGYQFIANEVDLQRDTVIRIVKEYTKLKKESLK
ncbi:Mor transcription activator family protein [Desemzia sp. FAM 24101]|uniref:Mor transcription activator family protein n=1 Tax=unclassified Desemzia TaxID=2685243 RepID=UPI003884C003